MAGPATSERSGNVQLPGLGRLPAAGEVPSPAPDLSIAEVALHQTTHAFGIVRTWTARLLSEQH